jgi:glycosyltransferase involved in cell wall biosynthesis
MRVLILATDIFTRGGIARYTSTLASSLGKLLGPQNVDVLCFFDWGGDSAEIPTDFRVQGMVSRHSRARHLTRARFLYQAAKAGFGKYDLVIVNHIALAPVAAMMKLAFGTPYWVVLHSTEIWWGTSPWRHKALQMADQILPVSRYTADVVKLQRGIEASRVRVLYNAIPDDFAHSLQSCQEQQAQPESPLALSVCSLIAGNEFKGIDKVLQALPTVLQRHPKLRYVVVGEGAIRPSLQRMAADMGLGASVSFLGEISNAALGQLYRDCNLFILPSRGQEQQGQVGGEGFGRVYVEAALAAKPVVGSRSGGAAEAVLDGETGLLVDPTSADEIAQAMCAILDNDSLAAAMGQAGRRWCLQTFSEESVSKTLKELLQSCCRQSEVNCAIA